MFEWHLQQDAVLHTPPPRQQLGERGRGWLGRERREKEEREGKADGETSVER